MNAAIVVLTGPECSGKTTMARLLSYRYKTTWLPEYARHYLNGLAESSAYTEHDLEQMVEGTIEWITQVHSSAKKVLFQDTGKIVYEVWGELSFGRRPKNLDRLMDPDLYLLCSPDIPYTPDPLREHPNERHLLYDMYFNKLSAQHVPFAILEGALEHRMASAEIAINKMRSQRRSQAK